MSERRIIGWVVRVVSDGGTERYYGDAKTKSGDPTKVRFFPDKRKATRKAATLKKKNVTWDVATMKAYRDPPAPKGGWQPFKEVPFENEDHDPESKMYVNNLFTVVSSPVPSDGAPEGFMRHLSIHREDRNAAHDWRAFQRIKDEILGPEFEAVELYPARSRLVDADQSHLWAFATPGVRFPVGFTEQHVTSGDSGMGHE